LKGQLGKDSDLTVEEIQTGCNAAIERVCLMARAWRGHDDPEFLWLKFRQELGRKNGVDLGDDSTLVGKELFQKLIVGEPRAPLEGSLCTSKSDSLLLRSRKYPKKEKSATEIAYLQMRRRVRLEKEEFAEARRTDKLTRYFHNLTRFFHFLIHFKGFFVLFLSF